MKERLDVILVNQGYAASREKAKAIIMSGVVYVDGQKEDKAGTFFDESKIRLEVRGSTLKYVSRGGLKLEKAVDIWQLDFTGQVCMDIGASTGGFTDCMLQNGAAKVYAVDVGHGQLAWKLRNDERVVCMEQTNFRYVTGADIREELDFASVDVSFISLTKILIPARNLLKCGGQMVCLIKPQFEAGKGKVGKNISRIVDYVGCIGFLALHLDYSPIKGPEGNIEYLLHLEKEKEPGEAVRALSEREAENLAEGMAETGAGLSHTEEWKKLIGETVERSHKGV